ncbi:MAG: response regulator [Thermoanaerobaculia bacterium]|nr:response regulator [Thermoanaerobaculia bacterium]
MTEEINELAGLRILAVDDEEDVLATIEDVLEGVQLDTASDFETAIEKLKTERYDLAILDIMGVDGFALLTEAVNRKIPTVMLTAHAVSVESLKESISKGALAYLPKEQLGNLDKLLSEFVVEARKGNSVWRLIFDRLEDYFERTFGEDWVAEDPNYWRMYMY